MLLNREGRFKARVTEGGVDETGPNKLATYSATFAIEHEHVGGDDPWADVSAEANTITGYFYLEKRDGSINTRTIESLCEALGWDGQDAMWLQDTDLSERRVQLTVAMETYDGKTRPKVKWINHVDSEGSGGVKRADGAARTAIQSRLSSKLRAHGGGVQRPAPAPVAPRPAPVRTVTMEDAWGAFSATTASLTDADRERQWFRILGEMFPGRDTTTLTPAEWGRVMDEAPGKVTPF